MQVHYLFTSENLGFRNWLESDISKQAEINADPQVMAYFPQIADYEQTKDFVKRMQDQFAMKGFCYFAVDQLINNKFIGFIGLSEQIFESSFTPCVDIGWRLAYEAWGRGFATEGAQRCLDYAFDELELTKIIATCPAVNKRSERVMQKIGMIKKGTFSHPMLKDAPYLEQCVLYELERK